VAFTLICNLVLQLYDESIFFCVSLMSRLLKIVGRGYGVYHNFQQYFSYIVVVSFIGGGNRRTLRS
jgi:hypothetical protein